jgi:uncharacterized phiE125 gp8 family phage protein
MSAILIDPPAIEPVTLAEARAHLRLTSTDDDDYVAAMITAARIQVESATRRVLVDQTWRVYRDDWPGNGRVDLPIAPIQSVAGITVYDTEGEPTALPPTAWILDAASQPARLVLTGSAPLPSSAINGIEIDVVAGYGASGLSVPQPLRLAVMTLVARWYEDREGLSYGIVPSRVAAAFEALVAPFRVMRLA